MALWQGHTETVTSVAVFPDNERVASGSRDKTLRIWSMRTGTQLYTLGVSPLWVTITYTVPKLLVHGQRKHQS